MRPNPNQHGRRRPARSAHQFLMLWVLPLGSIVLIVALGLSAWLTSGEQPDAVAAVYDHTAQAGHNHAGTTSHNDFFTNYGSYMQRIGCLSTVTGEPDWPWIFTLIILNVGVILAYLRIYIFWTRSYLAEEKRDRNGKLMDLAQMFLWCAITGYAAGILMFVWPAYRLVAACLLILNIWSWRFAFNLSSFRVAFSAGRYRRLASSDALTGLPNRMAVREEIDRRINNLLEGKGNSFAVLFLDFDRFKLVNDTLGHEVGDELLKAIAGRLTGALSGNDTEQERGIAARIGGDEFVIVLDRVRNIDHAIVIAQQVVDYFETPFDLAERSVRSSPSIGVVLAASDYEHADQMLRDADIAMYAAKKDERSSVVLFDKAMLAEFTESMELENDLHHALTRNELHLCYQPLVNIESGMIDGFEAMVRWQHPTRGLIAPDRFIGIAEATREINAIGEWVFTESARQLAKWTKADIAKHWRMRVSISKNQVYDDKLSERFKANAQAAGVAPQRLVLEVTESTFITDIEATTRTLGTLRDAGFILAMDDFGTGYSSLSLLHRFPIHELKIDRAFIVNMSDQPDYAAVIHAIISLAENLRIQVVGEGIETPEQLAELQALGCHFAQGYYFSKPLPPEQAFVWAEQWGKRRASA